MARWRHSHKSLAAVGLLVALGPAMAGCGIDGVEFNGKVFDALGVSNVGKDRGEAKVSQRAPLVVPPNLQQLPQPGVPVGAQPGAQPGPEQAAWPNDPDRQRLAAALEEKRKRDEYCRGESNWRERAQKADEVTPKPYNCGNILSNWMNKTVDDARDEQPANQPPSSNKR